MNSSKKLKLEDIKNILIKGDYAVLAITDGNEPYTLSLSYALDKDIRTLYFLTDKEGMKLDFLKSNPYVCGTVINKVYNDECSKTCYHSVVFRGVMEVIHNPQEQHNIYKLLLESGQRYGLDKKKIVPPMIMKLEWEEIDGRSSF